MSRSFSTFFYNLINSKIKGIYRKKALMKGNFAFFFIDKLIIYRFTKCSACLEKKENQAPLHITLETYSYSVNDTFI